MAEDAKKLVAYGSHRVIDKVLFLSNIFANSVKVLPWVSGIIKPAKMQTKIDIPACTQKTPWSPIRPTLLGNIFTSVNTTTNLKEDSIYWAI